MTTPAPHWNPAPRTREIALQLTRWASVTTTADEAGFTDRLLGLLRDIPYFRDNPDDIAVIDSHRVAGGTAMARSVVALVRGKGRRTLALAGHFDVVSIENYGDLKHLAFAPEALTGALIADLSQRDNLSEKEKSALDDLRSGDFIPGRGLLDMKSGDAAGIAFLEHFASQPDRRGNVVLFLTPDEERNSCGMRSLRNALPGLMARWNLEIVGGINLDASSDQGDGTDGRVIYHGSVGKLLPFAFVAGQPTHAGYPFDGISAHALAAEIMTAMEANTALCDRGRGEVAPPPVCLECRDVRDTYEVTTPEHVWMAFNWLMMGRSCADVMAEFRDIVTIAGERALHRFGLHGRQQARANHLADPAPLPNLRVLSIAELREIVVMTGGNAAIDRLADIEAAHADNNNPLQRSRLLVQAMMAEARLRGPAVVIGFGSLHYPAVHLDPDAPKDAHFLAAIDRARTIITKRHDTTICDRGYFMGISDMSFFGHAPNEAQTAIVAANTPVSELVDHPVADALSWPVVNIGPWGREYHQRHERLYAPYAFDVLPDFIAEIAGEILDRD
ncbi:M20/M25/M40 family metallo-hydrolase [Thalassospira sp.]|uniref:M20/M25/M40 family metallo-hydrolase n=1 Tax=Thalassospira sp. TaxID=1912094 RepID=UPI0027343FB9|nr:M20/M25/M40 family metallo-hydrolase [Thalassospira sp.]MDP2698659.1 M20/M25/M40 family metallo-hydrolase [Thalassospira sp.]